MFPTLNHEIVLISDIHLRTEDDDRGRLLLNLLASIDAAKVRYLVLLGDIFDFCAGHSPYFHKKFEGIGQALTSLTQQGVKVCFIEGNHEFLIRFMPWLGVHFVGDGELQIKLSDGKSLVLAHGDLLRAPWHYHLYSRLIRSEASRILSQVLPQNFLDNLALAISGKSRDRGYSRKIDHKAIVATICQWAQSRNADYGIVGHFHAPYDVKDKDGKTRILCLDSWDKPNCLCYDAGRFYRIYPKEGALGVVELPL